MLQGDKPAVAQAAEIFQGLGASAYLARALRLP